MKSYEHLQIEQVEKSVVVVRINRPHAKNALNSPLVEELVSFMEYFSVDKELKVLILTGNEDVFIAGADIREMMGASVAEALKISTKMMNLHKKMINTPKPIIAAINGYCLGGGFELALACDIKIAGRSAIFGLPEITLGIIPGGGGTQRLLDIVGPSIANRFILTGELISAERAYSLNIVSDLVDNPLETAIGLANKLAKGSSNAIAAAKQLVTGMINSEQELRLQHELQKFAMLFDYPDSVEGLSAFIEKRKPEFR